MNQKPIIHTKLAESLVATQFPKWKDLPITPIEPGGWDNRCFRLGNEMVLRFPSAECYVAQVEKEQAWLPKLAPSLPLSIPTPLAMGTPSDSFPWKWSIYRYLEGTPASIAPTPDRSAFAVQLAEFLLTFQKISTKKGPPPGPHCFHRGGDLRVYDAETREALTLLKGQIDTEKAAAIWEAALDSKWEKPPVWVHGDLNESNLLTKDGKLTAVIDFGMLNVGDPACDLSIAWTFFDRESRDVFFRHMSYDADTLMRGKAWTLWKALIVAAGLTQCHAINAHPLLNILLEV